MAIILRLLKWLFPKKVPLLDNVFAILDEPPNWQQVRASDRRQTVGTIHQKYWLRSGYVLVVYEVLSRADCIVEHVTIAVDKTWGSLVLSSDNSANQYWKMWGRMLNIEEAAASTAYANELLGQLRRWRLP